MRGAGDGEAAYSPAGGATVRSRFLELGLRGGASGETKDVWGMHSWDSLLLPAWLTAVEDGAQVAEDGVPAGQTEMKRAPGRQGIILAESGVTTIYLSCISAVVFLGGHSVPTHSVAFTSLARFLTLPLPYNSCFFCVFSSS